MIPKGNFQGYMNNQPGPGAYNNMQSTLNKVGVVMPKSQY